MYFMYLSNCIKIIFKKIIILALFIFILFVFIRIVGFDNISKEDNNLALNLLRQFVKIYSILYSPQFVNYNVYSSTNLQFSHMNTKSAL